MRLLWRLNVSDAPPYRRAGHAAGTSARHANEKNDASHAGKTPFFCSQIENQDFFAGVPFHSIGERIVNSQEIGLTSASP